jgi:cell division protein FtsL
MRVPHNALVLVADGRKMLLLKNEGDAEHLNLQVEQKEIHEGPKDRDPSCPEASAPRLIGRCAFPRHRSIPVDIVFALIAGRSRLTVIAHWERTAFSAL